MTQSNEEVSARLRIERPDLEPLRIELPAGRCIVGRARHSQIHLDDPTVSDEHCEIEITRDGVTVRDLGSSNGTLVDDELVGVANLRENQRLQVGSITFVLEELLPARREVEAEAALAVETPKRPGNPATHCANHAQVPARWICTECHERFCSTCVKQVRLESGLTTLCTACHGLCEPILRGAKPTLAPRSLGGGLVEALSYPFRGNALLVLAVSTVFALIASLLSGARPPGPAGSTRGIAIFNLVSGIAGSGMALISFVLGAGVLLFIREVLKSSAFGELEPPDWPSFDFESMRETVVEFTAWSLVCFGPAMFWRIFVGDGDVTSRVIGTGLTVLGAGYGAVSLLGIVIHDGLSGLNPVLVVVSILRVPFQYLGFCLFVAALVLVGIGLEAAAHRVSAVLASTLVGAASTYGVLVCARALGRFYWAVEEELGWT